MTSLLALNEKDLAVSLEKHSVLVTLIAPDGSTIDTSANDGAALTGQVWHETSRLDPETGETFIINQPIVVLRRSSLSQVPAPGETWLVKVPVSPLEGAPIEDFVIDPTRSPEGGKSLGFIKLYLRRVDQQP